MFRQFSALVRDAFYDDSRFLTTRDQAFQVVLNDTSVFSIDMPQSKNRGCVFAPLPTVLSLFCPYRMGKIQPESRCPALLAEYCDLLLRKTPLSKKMNTDDIDAKLNDVVRLRLVRRT